MNRNLMVLPREELLCIFQSTSPPCKSGSPSKSLVLAGKVQFSVWHNCGVPMRSYPPVQRRKANTLIGCQLAQWPVRSAQHQRELHAPVSARKAACLAAQSASKGTAPNRDGSRKGRSVSTHRAAVRKPTGSWQNSVTYLKEGWLVTRDLSPLHLRCEQSDRPSRHGSSAPRPRLNSGQGGVIRPLFASRRFIEPKSTS